MMEHHKLFQLENFYLNPKDFRFSICWMVQDYRTYFQIQGKF